MCSLVLPFRFPWARRSLGSFLVSHFATHFQPGCSQMAENGGASVTSGTGPPTERVTQQISDLKLKEIEDEVTSSFVVIDIGANLTSSKYARDLDSVIDRAKDAGML